MRKPSIFTQALTWFGVVLAIFAALLGASLWRFSMQAESEEWTLHTIQVIEKTHDVLIDLLSIETGERGFAITGKESFLESLVAGTAALQKDFADLRLLTMDNPPQQLRLAALGEQIQKWRDSAIDPLVALRRKVDQGLAPEELVDEFISSESGKRQMEAMQATLASITAEEESLLRARQAALSEGNARLRHMLLWGGAAAMAAGIFIAFLTAKRLRNSNQILLNELSLRRQREEQIKEAQRLANIGSWRWDAKTDATFGTEELYRIYGLDPARPFLAFSEQNGRLYPSESWQRLNAAVQETMRTGVGYELDLEAIRNGAAIWITTRCEVVRDADGQIVGLSGTVQDITGRKKANEALRRSEERFRNIFNASASLLAITTLPEGRIIDVNDAFTALLGYTRQEILGKTTLESLWVNIEERKRLVKSLEAGERFTNEEVELRAKTGDIKTVLMSSTLMDIYGEQCIVTSVIDITKRKQAEQDQRISEARLHLALDASHAGIWEWDVQTGENFWSEELWSLYGLEPHSRKPSYDSWLESIHPDDRIRAGQVLQEAASRGEDINMEWRVNTPTGAERWLLARGRPLHAADGRVARYLGIVLDITPQKRLEQSLRHAKEEWEQTFASVPDLIAIIDDQYRLVRVNQAMAKRLGCTPEQCEGLACYQAVHGLDTPPSSCPYVKMLADDREHTEEVYEERFDGYFLVSVTPLRDEHGRTTGSVHVARDITARKRVEEALERQAEDLESLVWERTKELHQAMEEAAKRANILNSTLDAIAEGLIVFGPDREIVRMNQVAEQVFRYTREEKALPYKERLFSVKVETEDGVVQEVDSLPGFRALQGETVRGEVLSIQRQGHLPVWASVNAAPILDRAGGVVGAIVTFQDVSARKKMERELQQAKEEAETANRAKSEFLASMSHEIRTPMNGIMGMIELVNMSCKDTRPREYLEYAKRSAFNLLDIVNDILDLSKIEAGRVELEKSIFGPREMLENLFVIQGYQAEQKGLRFTAHVDQNVPERLMGDEGRLRQIFTNLVSNAVKYTRQGEVTVHVTAEVLEQGPAQGVHGRSGPVSLIFSIRDTGIGIAPDKLPRIFEPFTRGSQDAEFGGTGLGLTITKQLVELMHGRIDVRSTLNQGSTFTVSVLLEAAPEEAAPTEPLGGGVAQGQVKPLKILLAEDNEVNRFMAVELLKLRGHEVVTVENGKLALEALAKEAFDLVLMDAQMPVMDGVEATRRIRAGEAGNPNVPITALTAYALKDDRERFLAAGMDDYLSKPIDLEELDRVLARVWSGEENA